MKPSLLRVLEKLQEKKSLGVTWDDFSPNKEIPKRICELKDIGYKIARNLETLPGGCRRARYFLLKEPRP